MIRRPPRSTRTDTLFPYTTLFRSLSGRIARHYGVALHIARYDRPGTDDSAPSNEFAAGEDQGIVADPDIILDYQRIIIKNIRIHNTELLLLKRSEEHTSELQSLMRISYAVFCLKKKKITKKTH